MTELQKQKWAEMDKAALDLIKSVSSRHLHYGKGSWDNWARKVQESANNLALVTHEYELLDDD